MCCRYYILPDDPDLYPMVETAAKSQLIHRFDPFQSAPFVRSGEVAPTNLAPVIASDRRLKPAVFPMRWGFNVPGRGAPVVNARVETAPEKPSFREAWQKHRCVVPASWYFEWQHLPGADSAAERRLSCLPHQRLSS